MPVGTTTTMNGNHYQHHTLTPTGSEENTVGARVAPHLEPLVCFYLYFLFFLY